MLWALFALLCLAVLAILIVPVLKGNMDARPRVEYDIVVYRNQLAEIDSEVEEGLLSAEQADAARAEVHRRMLAAEDAELSQPLGFFSAGNRYTRIGAAIAIAILIPAGAFAFYAKIGSPNLPGKPYMWRIHNDPEFATASTADKLAAMVAATPSADGYAQLGRTYFAAREYEQAAAAYRKAIELGANDAVAMSEFGEAVVMVNGGAVVPEAMLAFAKAVSLEPKSERSRFYLGLAEAQIGNTREAVGIWKDLEKSSDPSAPWLPMLREHIAAFAKQGGFDPASVPASPPDVKAMGAALSAMNKAMQMAPATNAPKLATTPAAPAAPASGAASSGVASGMGSPATSPAHDPMVIEMVKRLADRMEKSPSDVAGWQRLAHAYVVIGEPAKAKEAAKRAVRLKPDDISVQLSLAEAQRAASPNEELPMDFVGTMRQVLKLDPNNGHALYVVGLAEAKAGRNDQAKALWTKALSTAKPGDPMEGELKSRLKELDGKK
ncbi:cytochrome c-type biogenesis protein CcmH [Rhizomicrobium palustre]|uniref:Cytochrome c-type biogenesis protein CcmH n=1 Tax=Rhizomicrobium palustre TaxID=189966 RepID=A0A846MV53_9PROT|nr:c-type cytochrome biogenesis protein CcmI [Rhizomicrobium palustre]NIK87408.1 cytochrome c-type biogenesis protein CcmH [Rhizomicrobium palustre]